MNIKIIWHLNKKIIPKHNKIVYKAPNNTISTEYQGITMNATEMSGRTDSTAGVINLFGI